jgi:hypothetical protein
MKGNSWFWILLTGLCILLINSVVACASVPSSAPTEQLTPTEQPEKKPAQFEIGALTVMPGTVMVGSPATVTTTVINNGDITGTYTASLLVDGKEVDRKDITVDPASTKTISFQVIKTTAGSYELTLGDSNAKLTVCTWTPQTIQYDSGVYDPQMMGTYVWSGAGHIVRFTPLTTTFKIKKISISAFTQVENFADLNKRMFTVRIWNDNKTIQLWSDEFPWSLFIGGGWKDIDVPDILADGEFYVEVVSNSDAPPSQNCMAINWEESKGEARSGISMVGKVFPTAAYAGKDKRWFIRVTGEGPTTECVSLSERPEQLEEAASGRQDKLTIPSMKLVCEDHFNNPASGWRVESTEKYELYYGTGEYHIVVKSPCYASWPSTPGSGVLKDFVLEADSRLVDGPTDGREGLFFHYQNNDNFYVFEVSGNGYYFIGTRTNGQWTALTDWTRSEFIKEGYSENHLQVICKGPQIQTYVNGRHLATVTDNVSVTGRVGVIVDTIEPNAHVAFDNLKVFSSD